MATTRERAEPLAQNHGKEDRRAAVDICYSVPKDVSVPWVEPDDAEWRRIEAPPPIGVTEALNYLSDTRLHEKRARGLRPREGRLTHYSLIHRQSRNQHPQVHVHYLVLNTVPRHSDGEYSTLTRASPSDEKARRCGGPLRTCAGARDSTRAGSIRVSRAGVPKDLSEYWSSRAREIERTAKERGLGGARVKQQIALETRRVKDERPLCQMKPERKRPPATGLPRRRWRRSSASGARRLTPDHGEAHPCRDRNSVDRLTSQHGPLHEMSPRRDVCIATVTMALLRARSTSESRRRSVGSASFAWPPP